MAEAPIRLYVTDMQGETHVFETEEGWRAMEVIRDHGLPIKAECGGAAACATCHVYVEDDWLPKLYPPGEQEEDRLDEAKEVKGNSRLSCQIVMRPDLDGLKVTLAPGSEP